MCGPGQISLSRFSISPLFEQPRQNFIHLSPHRAIFAIVHRRNSGVLGLRIMGVYKGAVPVPKKKPKSRTGTAKSVPVIASIGCRHHRNINCASIERFNAQQACDHTAIAIFRRKYGTHHATNIICRALEPRAWRGGSRHRGNRRGCSRTASAIASRQRCAAHRCWHRPG